MKQIVYVLIAANLILFMALMWEDTTPDAPVLPMMSGVEKLVLVIEKKPREKSNTSVSDKQTARVETGTAKKIDAKQVVSNTGARSATSAGQCYLMAYFGNQEDAESAVAGLQALDYKAELDLVYPEKARLLVYLPAYPDIKQARKVTRDLKKKGIRDFQILAIRGSKNAISLGVFSHADTAKERIKEMRDLGYHPIVQSVVGPSIRYRVYFHKTGRTVLNAEERRFLINSFKKVKITTTKCQS